MSPAPNAAGSSTYRRTPAPAAGRTGARGAVPPPTGSGGRAPRAAGPAARRSADVRGRHRRRSKRPRPALKSLALVLAVVTTVAVLVDQRGADVGAEVTTAASGPVTPAPTSAAPSPSPSAVTATPSAPPVFQIAGPVPSAGRGTFGYDDRTGPLLGEAGVLRRYRVAVEDGAGEDPTGFGAAVEAALRGPGSWVDSGRLRLQQVPEDSAHDFTVYLATARTAGRMCLAGGVDIRIGGKPYTSCRAPGKVIVNLDRWRLSVPHFVALKVPLSVYRLYVVNHEVGHQLGNRHERCPGRGRPAPVMMQQTLFLDGCVANPWPYRDGRRYSGPPV